MARRTVSVYLELLAQQFHREGRQIVATAVSAGRSVDDLGDQADGAARDMLQLATTTEVAKRQVDDLGDEARGSAADLALLQGRLDATTARIRNLGAAYAATGDESFLGDVRKERRLIGQIERLRADMGGRRGAGLGDLLGGIPSIGGVPGPVIAGGAAAAAALSPFLGGVIASAVLGGVGTGGLIGGVALAAQDVRVKAAFKGLGQTMFTELGDAASPFVKPLTQAATMFGEAWGQERRSVQRDFSILAESVEPISKGIAGFVHQLHPGLTAAFKASIPIAHQFGDETQRFGGAMSDFLESMADSAPGARIALHDLFTVLDEGLTQLGDGIHFLSETYEWSRKLGLVAPPEWLLQASQGLIPTVMDLAGGVNAYHRNLNEAVGPAAELNRQLKDQEDAAKLDRDALLKLTKTIDDYYDSILPPIDAAERWEGALDDLTAAAKENGRTLDIHTDKGRANRDALEAAFESAQKMLQTGAETEEQYRSQIKMLEKLGLSLFNDAGFVSGLADQFGRLPSQIKTDLIVNTPGLPLALNLLHQFFGYGRALAAMGEHSGVRLPELTQGSRITTSGGQAFLEGVTPRAGGGELAPGVPYLFGERGPEVGVFAQPGVMFPSTQAYASTAATPDWGTPVVHVYIGGERIDERVDVRVEMAQRAAGDYATSGAR